MVNLYAFPTFFFFLHVGKATRMVAVKLFIIILLRHQNAMSSWMALFLDHVYEWRGLGCLANTHTQKHIFF